MHQNESLPQITEVYCCIGNTSLYPSIKLALLKHLHHSVYHLLMSVKLLKAWSNILTKASDLSSKKLVALNIWSSEKVVELKILIVGETLLKNEFRISGDSDSFPVPVEIMNCLMTSPTTEWISSWNFCKYYWYKVRQDHGHRRAISSGNLEKLDIIW